MEHVKSSVPMQSTVISKKRGKVIAEFEKLLSIWMKVVQSTLKTPKTTALFIPERPKVELVKALPPSGNFFISPFSVWSALVLAYFGSRGKTKAELEQVLRLTNREDTLALFRALERRYGSQEANQNYTINSANRIYIDQSIPVRECVGKVLDDKVKLTDFNRPDAAAADINAFINAETLLEIPVQASKDPQGQVFRNPGRVCPSGYDVANEKVQICGLEKFHAQVLEMPYRATVSMVVLLPRSGRGQEVDRLVQRLKPKVLVSELKAMPSVSLRVKFPKFSVESTLGDELISYRNPGKLDVNLCWTSRWWLKGKLARKGF
nr:serine protease inhibitor 88Ea-like [Penaeus vannamei]